MMREGLCGTHARRAEGLLEQTLAVRRIPEIGSAHKMAVGIPVSERSESMLMMQQMMFGVASMSG
jgi:hypothetical protein